MFEYNVNGAHVKSLSELYKYIGLKDIDKRLFEALKGEQDRMYSDVLGAVLTRNVKTGRTRDFTAAHIFHNDKDKKITVRIGVLKDRSEKRSPFYINALEEGTVDRYTRGTMIRRKSKSFSGIRANRRYRGRLSENGVVYAASYLWQQRLNKLIPEKIKEFIESNKK